MTTAIDPDRHLYELTTRGGIVLDIRPATAADEAGLAEFFAQVSEEDRRFRFFSLADRVSREQIQPLISADHFRTESFIAFDKRGDGAIIASGLLACDGKLDTAEVAVSVAASYRGQGVGWALLDVLAQESERRGVRRVISIESRENRAAIDLEREKGFTPENFPGDPSLVLLSKTFR